MYCIHEPSGAQGYSEDTRSQQKNKEIAFERMAKSEKFKLWHKLEVSRRTGFLREIEAKVEEEMKKIRIEGKNDEGNWVEI